jgi:hypothetical protein
MNQGFEILLALNWLVNNYKQDVTAILPSLAQYPALPSAFWMRRA